MISRITPFLWFDTEAEQAAQFYVGIFPNSKITHVSRYPEVGQDIHGKPAGTVQTVCFELDGLPFIALNGGPHFKFSEAISFQVACETQEEVDHYFDRLSVGGPPEAQRCGWLKDQFGLSWQIVPNALFELLGGSDRAAANRAYDAMLTMGKLDIAALRRAFDQT